MIWMSVRVGMSLMSPRPKLWEQNTLGSAKQMENRGMRPARETNKMLRISATLKKC